jgi:hypothetical protein
MADQAGLNTRHEPFADPVLMLAKQWANGQITRPEHIANVLDELDWPEVVADFALAPLAPVLAVAWPDTTFIIITRHPVDTVASMVRKGWYDPTDRAFPAVYQSWYKQSVDGSRLDRFFNANYPGLRVTGDEVIQGGVDRLIWADWSKPQRCAWWWDWSLRRLLWTKEHSALWGSPGNWHWVRLEDPDVGRQIGDLLGVSGAVLPKMGLSGAEEARTGEAGTVLVGKDVAVDSWWDRVEDLADQLGYTRS